MVEGSGRRPLLTSLLVYTVIFLQAELRTRMRVTLDSTDCKILENRCIIGLIFPSLSYSSCPGGECSVRYLYSSMNRFLVMHYATGAK